MNLSLKNDFIDENLFKEIILNDPNFNEKLLLIKVKNDKPIAYVFGVRRTKEPKEMIEQHKDIIWIKSFGACKNEYLIFLKELLKDFENIAKENKCKYIRISDFASWFITAGVDIKYNAYNKLLASIGFNIENKVIDYELDLSEFYIPSYVDNIYRKISKEKIKIFNIKEEDEEVFKWIKINFSPFWALEAINALKRKNGGILIAYKNKDILGFSVYGAYYPSRFGPIGVESKMRGKGIGTILLYKTIKKIRINGQRIAVIPWVGKKVTFFYTQLPGIKKIRYFNIYSKCVSNDD
ncbi:MAG: GNAT family N-acetyltransferase [Candidatus Micrarchaeia archaeon]